MLNLTSKQTDLAQGLITTKLQPEQIKSGKKIVIFFFTLNNFSSNKYCNAICFVNKETLKQLRK